MRRRTLLVAALLLASMAAIPGASATMCFYEWGCGPPWQEGPDKMLEPLMEIVADVLDLSVQSSCQASAYGSLPAC